MKLYATGVLLAVLSGAPAQADEAGAALYEPCRSCHSLDPAGPVMAGPNLARLVGRRVGSDPRFDYSPVLRKAAAESELALRAAQIAAAVTPIARPAARVAAQPAAGAAPNRFAAMGVVGETAPGMTDLDAVLRRRRAVG
jgi:hypothetical protein